MIKIKDNRKLTRDNAFSVMYSHKERRYMNKKRIWSIVLSIFMVKSSRFTHLVGLIWLSARGASN